MTELVNLADNKQSNNPTGKGGFGDNPQNINRNGRPPKELCLSDILAEKLEEVIKVKTKDGKQLEKIKKDVLADVLIDMALGRDITAIRELFNRVEGMPTKKVELLGKLNTTISQEEEKEIDEYLNEYTRRQAKKKKSM